VKLSDLENLFARIARITGQVSEKAGPGTSWDYEFPGGSTTTYEITNVKTHEVLLDQFSNLAVWTWSIKDYLKQLSETLGTTPQAIEAYVNSDPNLPFCADLANLLKHGELTRSRSGEWPASVKPSYVITHAPSAPTTPIKSIQFTHSGVKLDVSDPALVEIKFNVTNKSGARLRDGLECLAAGISSWESLLKRLEALA
jgi:hypothetical protein